MLFSLALLPLAVAVPTYRLAQAPMMVRDMPTDVEFDSCLADSVQNVTISPCEGGNGTMDNPCQFTAGSNYTITLTYTPPGSSEAPRANLEAFDLNGDGYAYSGQSFGACSYTDCPIQEDVASTYVYEFVTLESPFDQLTFNMTDGIDGPSLMCASFPIIYIPPPTSKRSVLPRLPFGGLGARKMMGI